MDRTTLTANLKPLQRRELINVDVDPDDRRGRRLSLTDAGRTLLAQAYPIWEATHEAAEERLGGCNPDQLRSGLVSLS